MALLILTEEAGVDLSYQDIVTFFHTFGELKRLWKICPIPEKKSGSDF